MLYSKCYGTCSTTMSCIIVSQILLFMEYIFVPFCSQLLMLNFQLCSLSVCAIVSERLTVASISSTTVVREFCLCRYVDPVGSMEDNKTELLWSLYYLWQNYYKVCSCPMCCVNAVLLSVDHVQWTLYFSDHWLGYLLWTIFLSFLFAAPHVDTQTLKLP